MVGLIGLLEVIDAKRTRLGIVAATYRNLSIEHRIPWILRFMIRMTDRVTPAGGIGKQDRDGNDLPSGNAGRSNGCSEAPIDRTVDIQSQQLQWMRDWNHSGDPTARVGRLPSGHVRVRGSLGNQRYPVSMSVDLDSS